MLFQKGHKINLNNKYNWKGENAGKEAMHRWVEKWKGKPKKCEICKTEKAPRFEWANIDHRYKRILGDYIRMCPHCHRQYDKNRKVKTKQFIYKTKR